MSKTQIYSKRLLHNSIQRVKANGPKNPTNGYKPYDSDFLKDQPKPGTSVKDLPVGNKNKIQETKQNEFESKIEQTAH